MKYENSREFAIKLDQEDPLAPYREKFHLPVKNEKPVIYFTGNSLGLQPKETRRFVEEELNVWEKQGVEGHFDAPERPWMHYHKFSKPALAMLTGAKESEVVSMNNLTSNLHLMMVSFYRPNGKRTKILIEEDAFPSDHYVVESQIKYHGLSFTENVISMKARTGEYILRTEDIISTIKENADSLALILLPGVQYYTGQFFEIARIAQAAHEAGSFIGLDLAHAIGNVPLNLHANQVDFAVWCSYKYLNSGPGAVSGIFVHKNHHGRDLPRFAGWWGHDEKERFKMEKGFIPMEGVDAWQLSNYNVLSGAAHLAALSLFEEAGMDNLRKKSVQLTGFLQYLLEDLMEKVEIITPNEQEQRGCQLSIRCLTHGKEVFNYLIDNNVLADWREPEVIRVAPVPLYNSYEEVYTFVEILKAAFDE